MTQNHTTQPEVRSLWRDTLFRWALLLGMAGCWPLAQLLGVDAAISLERDWRQLAWLVLLYPVLEEWLFRGQLQPLLMKSVYGRRAWYGVTLANIATSVAFTAFHFLAHSPVWALSVLFPSLLFGGFRDRYQSILPAIVLHCGYNLAYFMSFGMPLQVTT